MNNICFFLSSARKCVLNILCFFFIDVRIPFVTHGLLRSFLFLRDSFFSGACMSIVFDTILANLENKELCTEVLIVLQCRELDNGQLGWLGELQDWYDL